jgi:hypothetical protein
MRDVRELSSGTEIRDEELTAVPGHPRQVPGEEAEPRAVGRDPEIGVEVTAACDDARLGRAVRRHCYELVEDVPHPAARRMPLADTDPEAAVRRNSPVRVPMSPVPHLGRDRHRRPAGIDTIEPLVVEVGDVRGSIVDAVGASAVLVDARPHVEARRHDVRPLAVALCLHEYDSAVLVGASFEPPHGSAFEPGHREERAGPRDQLRRDRGRPRSVRGDRSLCDLEIQRRAIVLRRAADP